MEKLMWHGHTYSELEYAPSVFSLNLLNLTLSRILLLNRTYLYLKTVH